MIGVTDKEHTVMVFEGEDLPDAQSSELRKRLQSAGFVLVDVRDISSVDEIDDAAAVDIFINYDNPVALSWMYELAARPLTERPLLCMVTAATKPPSHSEPLDILLPTASIAFLERTLLYHISHREQLKQVEHDRDELHLLKNAIVRNVSHELKTPLLQVKSAVALIAEDNVDEKLSRMAVQATARLETVVKNITLLADSMNADFGPVLIPESVDHAIRNLRRIWAHKEAISRISTDVEDGLPPVLGSKQGIGVVLQQLLDNALKFSEASIVVQAERQGDNVRISVIDRGIGIESSERQRIFESFFQVDSSSTRRYGGTGVGLAIVRLIMEKHGTEIKVESEVGTGSTFSFLLPTITLD